MIGSDASPTSTGISEIDSLCGGGVPRGTFNLVEETGTERSNFPSFYLCMKFLKDGFSKGERGVLLVTEHSVSEYFKVAPALGVDLLPVRKAGMLTVIDAFSSYAGLAAQLLAKDADVTIDSPTNTVKILDEMRRALFAFSDGGYNSRIRIVIDSFSTLMNAAGFQKSWGLLLALVPIHKVTGCSTMGIFFPGMHAPNEVESCERLADGVITFHGLEGEQEGDAKSFVQVRKMRRNPFSSEKTTYTRKEWDLKIHLKKRLSEYETP